jgi:Fe-S cluster assembly iron-binding protein IscA
MDVRTANDRRLHTMLKITSKAISVLKATAKSKAGVSDNAGIRITRDAGSRQDGTIRVGLDVCDRPEAGDAEFEEDGLHIFVEDAVKEPLEDRTLDVRNEEESPRFIFT